MLLYTGVFGTGAGRFDGFIFLKKRVCFAREVSSFLIHWFLFAIEWRATEKLLKFPSPRFISADGSALLPARNDLCTLSNPNLISSEDRHEILLRLAQKMMLNLYIQIRHTSAPSRTCDINWSNDRALSWTHRAHYLASQGSICWPSDWWVTCWTTWPTPTNRLLYLKLVAPF